MESVATGLYRVLKNAADVELVAYGGSNKKLLLEYPRLFFRALIAGRRQNPDVIYVQDGVMAPIGYALRFLLQKPVVVTIHGKEVTYQNPFYRLTVLPALRRLDAAVVISEQTRSLATRALGDSLVVHMVKWGVSDTFYDSTPRTKLATGLEKTLKLSLKNRKILYTSGRLIKRKGAKWFIENVMPGLVQRHPEVMYLVSGKGSDYDAIQQIITEQKLSSNVRLLGYVDDATRDALYNTADFFIMPNVSVEGDMEGFGMVALEAASCGTPVIASGIEGIADAVLDGRTGHLLPAGDAVAYRRIITAELDRPTFDRTAVRRAALQTFNWDKTAAGYLDVFASVDYNVKH